MVTQIASPFLSIRRGPALRKIALASTGFAILLFVASSLRHALVNSNAFDLGIFDQALYLISRG